MICDKQIKIKQVVELKIFVYDRRVHCYKGSYENYRFPREEFPYMVLSRMRHKNHGYSLVRYNKTFYSVYR